MLRLLNTEPEDYSAEALAVLQGFAEVDARPLSRAELISSIGEYEALIVRLGHKIDQEILDQAGNLKVIVTATTGLNHLDMDALKTRNIDVLCLRGEREFLNNITATSEHCFALLLSLVRHLPRAHQSVMNATWERDDFKGSELAGKTIGIIGYGRLGLIVARYAKAFGMEVLVHDIDVQAGEDVCSVSRSELLARSDIVSLHVNYSKETHHLIDAQCFEAMKQGALFINTARGEIVDEGALLSALQSGHVGGAALDVLQGENGLEEDWVNTDPLIQYAKTHDNLIITPHIGGATYDSMVKTEIFMAQKLKNWHENHS